MNKLLLFIVLLGAFSACNTGEDVMFSEGIVVIGNDTVATYEAIKIVKADSIIWIYAYSHGKDSTNYQLSLHRKTKNLQWSEELLVVTDSIACGTQLIWVYDLIEEESNIKLGAAYLSQQRGLLAVSNSDIENTSYLEEAAEKSYRDCVFNFLSNQ